MDTLYSLPYMMLVSEQQFKKERRNEDVIVAGISFPLNIRGSQLHKLFLKKMLV